MYKSIISSNNLAQYNAYSNYWYPLTGLVEELADNKYYDFSHVLQNKSATRKTDAKSKSPPDHTKSQEINGVL